MKVAIVGSRNYPDLGAVRAFVYSLPEDTTVVSGGARGVDRAAVAFAKQRGLPTVEIPALWEKYGRMAGFLRNGEIVAQVERIVAFWDGRSRGTADTIAKARAAGKDVEIR